MKQLIIILIGLGFATFYLSCDKDNNSLSLNQEELLIEQIVTASTVESVGVREFPGAISDYVHVNHAPYDIDLAFHAAPHGYEVFLENGLCLYFDQNGNHLNHDGLHGDMGNHHGGGDPGINFCLAGDTLDIATLPQEVIDYIAANHFGASAVTLVVKPSGNLAVEISTGDILMFSPSGNYYHDCDMQGTGGHGHEHGNIGSPGWHCDPDGNTGGGHGGPMGHGNHGGMDNHSGPDEPCWGGTSISIDDLPTAITTYINANHTDAIIEHVMQSFNDNYFLRLSDCARLVFDEDGNILFDSGD
jgi:putative PepSY-like beta-lactamase-inhibitor